MMLGNAYFKLNDEFIEIQTHCGTNDIFRFDDARLLFQDSDGVSKVLFSNDYIIDALGDFDFLLTKALNGTLLLDKSIDPNKAAMDIGYLWNEELQNKDYLVMKVNPEGIKYWVGTNYLLWSTPGSAQEPLETWLYNYQDKIFLEITPVYKWHFTDPEKGEKFISYDQFLNDYKPYVVREISIETAIEWHKQVKDLLKIIEQNDKKHYQLS